MSNLGLRVVSACVMVALALPSIWVGGFVFAALAALVCCIVWYEWLSMNAAGYDDRAFFATALIILLCAVLTAFSTGSIFLLGVMGLWAIAGCLLVVFGLGSASILGFSYCIFAFAALVHLRGDMGSMSGLAALTFVLTVTFATDIAAYFVGRAVGGPKLAPQISPGKTISGALGGLAGALIAVMIVRVIFDPSMGLLAMMALAVAASIASQCGDLFESAMKRKAGVKDSSAVIPGHGGFMDRMDGLVFAAVLVWIVCIFLAGTDQPSTALFWHTDVL